MMKTKTFLTALAATVLAGCEYIEPVDVDPLLHRPVDRVEIMHSDTHGVPFGQGSYGSRTFSVEGAVIYIAAQKIKAKALTVGAHMLQAKPEEVEFTNGTVQVKGDPARVKTLQEIASWLWFAWDLPPGVEPGLEATEYFNPSDFNFPFGSHVATVEIDEQTGEVDVVDYAGVDDVGVIGNEMIVEGQMQGSIAFGFGPASWSPSSSLSIAAVIITVLPEPVGAARETAWCSLSAASRAARRKRETRRSTASIWKSLSSIFIGYGRSVGSHGRASAHW